MTAVASDALRETFARAMSAMYQCEAPQYGALVRLVAKVNRACLDDDFQLEKQLADRGEIERLGIERHGAIRLGTAEELSTVRRLFAVMGMAPVGYYDLSIAGIPVHSTAFRPITEEALRHAPFRMFTSLLRLDLIAEEDVRREAAAILARRRIFTPRCLELIDAYEKKGELNPSEANEFILEAVETFRWRSEATVSAAIYRKFNEAHPLIADVVCFKGPHVNHLTLPTLDIDAVQAAMAESNMNPKATIEGPPRRNCPILLRQTSFKAIQEPVSFKAADGSLEAGAHAARFGEIEQRGVALTAKGRALYDRLLEGALSPAPIGSKAKAPAQELAHAFRDFPDDWDSLHAQQLAFFRYALAANAPQMTGDAPPPLPIDDLLRLNYLQIEPITYEDFLPVSAAGIFRSNLGEGGRLTTASGGNRTAFEEALGVEVLDELALYAEAEARSRNKSLKLLKA